LAAVALAALPGLALAQNSSGGSISPAYSFEVDPFLGKNLPYDLWGADDGMLSVFGVRFGYRLPNPTGAVEASGFVHHKSPDKAFTGEVAYRHEVYSSFLNGYFTIGLHYSYFKLEPDYDASGNCPQRYGCRTDSGSHTGLSYGGGLMLPVGVYPIKLGVRFYQKPQSWLLLEAGYGIRF
jgi:hypothetical protein